MKFLILSDLHTEFSPYVPPRGVDFDVVVLAGDIGAGDVVPTWAAAAFGSTTPIAIVPGNHEYYGSNMQRRREQLQEAAASTPNVHVLDPGELVVDGRVRLLGCTLWTDFRAPVVNLDGRESNESYAIEEAWRHMHDYRGEIEFQTRIGSLRALEPTDTQSINKAERAWLIAKLSEPFAGATVVVTHHAPAMGSVPPTWADNWLMPAYVNSLPDDFFEVPAVWVHGHTYVSLDYRRGNARVVCNPRGYPLRGGGHQNAAFDPKLIIEVDEPIAPSPRGIPK